MNKYQTILSPFMGGFIGILISGYAYYLTNQHHPWVLPIGVFFGSAFGFFIGDIKKFFAKTIDAFKTIKFYTLTVYEIAKTGYKNQKKVVHTKVSKIPNGMNRIWSFVQKMNKSIFVWASHPVTKSILLRSMLSLCTFAVLNYFLFKLVIGFDIFHKIENLNNNTESESVFVGIYYVIILIANICVVFGGLIAKWLVYESITTFYKEWELYGNKFTLFTDNLKMDIKLFIYAQVLALIITSIMIGGIAYLAFVGSVCFITGLISVLVLSYLKALQEKTVIASFLTTLFVTTLSYFLFRNEFSNQVVIWSCAFFTGVGSTLFFIPLSSRIKDDEEFWIMEYMMDNIVFGIPAKVFKALETPFERLQNSFMAL